jgi:hypothetical protein
LPQILAWAAVSATVGVLLRLLENIHEKLGAIVSFLLGMAWSILTFFVVPVLVVEKVGPFEAITRSTRLLRKTWGEALISNWGIGLFMFLLALPGVALLIIGMILLAVAVLLGLAVMCVAGIYLLALMAVGPALHGICLAALYQYAAEGQVPNAFDARLLKGAFAHKSR